jgi:hypothetical protein
MYYIHWNLRPVLLQASVYADDVLLISDKNEHLQNAVIEWGSTFQEREHNENKQSTR